MKTEGGTLTVTLAKVYIRRGRLRRKEVEQALPLRINDDGG